MGESDDGTTVSVVTRIPNRGISLAIVALLTGGLGGGAALYNRADGATITAIHAKSEQAERSAAAAAADAAKALAASSSCSIQIEAMRADLLGRVSDRYTNTEASKINDSNTREHSLLKREIENLSGHMRNIDTQLEQLSR